MVYYNYYIINIFLLYNQIILNLIKFSPNYNLPSPINKNYQKYLIIIF